MKKFRRGYIAEIDIRDCASLFYTEAEGLILRERSPTPEERTLRRPAKNFHATRKTDSRERERRHDGIHSPIIPFTFLAHRKQALAVENFIRSLVSSGLVYRNVTHISMPKGYFDVRDKGPWTTYIAAIDDDRNVRRARLPRKDRPREEKPKNPPRRRLITNDNGAVGRVHS